MNAPSVSFCSKLTAIEHRFICLADPRPLMCDLDAVIFDVISEMTRLCVVELGVTPGPWLSWNHPVHAWGVTLDEFKAMALRWEREGLYRRLAAYPENVAAVRRVLRAGRRVRFETARPHFTADDTSWAVQAHFGDLNGWDIEHRQVKDNGADFIAAIDDNEDHAETLAASGCQAVFVAAQPYNEGTRFPRVRTVHEVADWLGAPA